MYSKTRRRVTAPIAIAALSGGIILTGIPASAMPFTTEFIASCRLTPSTSLASPSTLSTPASVVLDAPESVNAGEEFEITVQPGPISVPGSASGATVQSVSRIKIDLMVPDNATLVSTTILPGTSGGLSGTPPNILRVNENGAIDPTGKIIRLSGNNQVIGNSPTSSANSEGGILVQMTGKKIDGTAHPAGETEFQLPAVKAVLKAGESGNVEMKLRTAGDSGAWDNDKNFMTFLPKATLSIVTAWAPSRCSPRDAEGTPLNSGAGALTSTRIIQPDKTTTTTVVGANSVKNGNPVTLSANVSQGANGGTVQFYNGVDPLEAAAPVTNGSASITTTFTEDGPQSITAVYSGTTGFTSSTSLAKIVNVTTDAPPDAPTTTVVVGPNNAKIGQDINLTAQIDPAGTGGTVTFEVDGTPLPAVNVGTDGVAASPHTFSTTGTHRVVARFSGGEGFASSFSPAFPISVTVAAPNDVETTTTLNAPGTTLSNTPVTLTANVGPTGASGTVQFKIGNTPIGGPVNVVGGVATVPATFFNAGTYSVSAEFTGSTGYTSSASAPHTVTVTAPDGPDNGDTGSLDLGNLFGS